jgi:hypothetical protein
MKRLIAFLIIAAFIFIINSCGKDDSSTPPPSDPCVGVVSVSGTASNTTTGQSTGSITATATGGTGFTYSLNNGAYQSSGSFANLAAGTYTVTAKNSNGCTGTTQVTVNATPVVNAACVGAPGPLFTAVKTLLASNCVGCHNNTQTEGGMNWTIDCVIVINKDRIKARAVDASPSQMPPPPSPPLSAAQKKIITDWIAAGGTITN